MEKLLPSEIDSAFLKSHSFFGGISDADIEAIKKHFEIVEFPEGATIISEGEPNSRVWFILSGRVEVERKGCELAEFGPGDTFGEMEFLDIMPAAATCRSLCPVRLAALTGLSLHAIYKELPNAYAFLIMNLARDLSRRLRAFQKRLDGFTSRPSAV